MLTVMFHLYVCVLRRKVMPSRFDIFAKRLMSVHLPSNFSYCHRVTFIVLSIKEKAQNESLVSFVKITISVNYETNCTLYVKNVTMYARDLDDILN